jgi:hypothetical protein
VVVDRSNKRLIELKPGEYEIQMSQPGRELRHSTDRFTLPPGGKVLVRAWEADLAWPADKLRAGQILAPVLRGEKQTLQATLRSTKDLKLLKQKFPDGGDFGFARGHYFIHLPAGMGSRYATTNRWAQEGFAYELVGQVVKPESAGWGVALWHQDNKQGAIEVILFRDGTVQVRSTSQTLTGFGCTQVGPVAHPAIKSGPAANTLLILFKSPYLEVYVNGVAVIDPVFVDRDFKPGDMNLGAFPKKDGAEVEFFRVAATSADSLTSPRARGAASVR